jgi:transposase
VPVLIPVFFILPHGDKIMYKFFAGCDTHKSTHHITIIDQQGQTLESFEIENNLNGWIQTLNVFAEYEDLLCGIENHANYAKLFAKYLIHNNIPLKEVNPIFTGKKRKASTRRSKTDEIDALMVAKITRDEQNYLPDIIIDEKKDEIKSISDQRDNLVKEKVRLVNRLHSKLIQFDTQYKKRYGKDLCVSLHLIKEDFSQYQNIQSVLILKDIKRLNELINEIKEIEKIMKTYTKNDTLIKNLDSISGLDIINACKLASLIGDISKFKNADKFCSYAGVTPITFASGNYSKDVKNRGGQKELNNLLGQITKTQLRHNVEAQMYFDKKLSEGKSEKQAKVSLKKQITKIIYLIYKHNVPYNYERCEDSVLVAV